MPSGEHHHHESDQVDRQYLVEHAALLRLHALDFQGFAAAAAVAHLGSAEGYCWIIAQMLAGLCRAMLGRGLTSKSCPHPNRRSAPRPLRWCKGVRRAANLTP